MQLISVPTLQKRKHADLIVLPFWQVKHAPEPAFSGSEFNALLKPVLQSEDFLAKEGETLLLYRSKAKEKRVLLLGLGTQKNCKEENLRRAYAAAIKVALQKKQKNINILLPDCTLPLFCIAESTLLTNYSFDALKKDTLKEHPHPLLTKACLIGDVEIKQVRKIIEAVNFARDLVNGNADEVTPQQLSLVAKGLEKDFPAIKTHVLSKKEIEKEKLGLLLAVSKGSAVDPALIIMEYQGDPTSKQKTALVGKGVTYDTGGLNLKPTGSMETMKCDMSGAATVLAALRAVADLKLKVNLIAVIPTTENAIGPSSYKPGDVYTSYSGKTVEISNTDAEGRLVLADAISYCIDKFSPSRIIDFATLTGGIIIALGEEITGLFSNDDELACKLVHAGDVTYERLWRMPLPTEYKEMLKSKIADIQNSGGRKASSITGALFIQEFVKQVPWAHLDIAGSAYLSEPKHYNPTPATGIGVRLLVHFFENEEKERR